MNKKKRLTEEETKEAQALLELIAQEDLKSIQENFTLNDILLVRKYISSKIKHLSVIKKIYFADDDFLNYNKCREEIIKLKKYHKILGSLKENFTSSIVSPKEAINVSKKQHAINNILMLDFNYSDKSKALFKKYLKTTDYSLKIETLIKLREIYINATYELYKVKKAVLEKNYKLIAKENGLVGKLKDNKKEFYYLLDQEKYQKSKEEINLIKTEYKKCTRYLEEIEKLVLYEEKEYNRTIPKKYLELDDVDYNELITHSNCDQEFVKRLENLRDGKYIRKYGLGLEKFIPKELMNLFAKLEQLDDECLKEYSNLGRDILKNKLRNLKKGQNSYDDVEREFLKMVIKMFEKLPKEPPYEEQKDTSIYYDIIDALTYSDNNFSYVEKLIQENANIKNARKNNYHIIINLLDKFILNYKLKLVNQNLGFIDPNFYKEIIKAFYKNKVELTEEEQRIINERLDDFLDYVNKKKYASVKDINQDVAELKNTTLPYSAELDSEKIDQELKFLDFNLESIVKSYLRKYPLYKDDYASSTFMIEGIDNCAFTIDYQDSQNISFNIHLFDTSKIIPEDSEIIKGVLNGKDLLPKMKKGLYPTMSFTYRFLNYKHLSDLRFSPSVVYVDKIYTKEDLDNYRANEDLKNMYIFINNLKKPENINNIYTVEGLKETIFKALSNDLKRDFVNYKIPFIYEKSYEEAPDLIRLNHNAICDKLSKIPKDEAHKIFSILDEDIDKYYVPSPSEDTDIVFDTSSFLGYYLLNTLGKIQNNKYDIDKESENLKTYLEKLNSKRAYLPTSITKNNENKIKRLVRNYKKK